MSIYKTQAAMLSLAPASRRHDPVTSKEADRAISNSGKRSGDVMKAAALVNQYPGSTCRELASKGVMDNESLHKRLPDAVAAGLITKGIERRCMTSSRNLRAATWWPKGYGE